MNLFYQPLIDQEVRYLDEEESRHCIKVLRQKSGDLIRITDGKGFFYDASITSAGVRKCEFKIQQQTQEKAKDFFIHIAISPTKNADRIEWFVEKAVEFGVDKITLVKCENTERTFQKPDRLKKIAVSAMKQSLKATLPEITDVTDFSDLIITAQEEMKFIAYVDHTNPLNLKKAAEINKKYLVLIGPEGDFSPDELATALSHSFQKVSLGPSRLRTETAGLAACHILNLINT